MKLINNNYFISITYFLPVQPSLKPVNVVQSREIAQKFLIDLSNCPCWLGLSGLVRYPRFIPTQNRFLYWERTKLYSIWIEIPRIFNRSMTSFRILDFGPSYVRYISTRPEHDFGSRRLSLSAFLLWTIWHFVFCHFFCFMPLWVA